jgi:hypothetical protein
MNVWQFSLRDGDGEKLFFNWIAWRVYGDMSVEGGKGCDGWVCVYRNIVLRCAKNFHPNLLIPHCIPLFFLALSLPPTLLALHDDISHVPTYTIWALGILLAFLMPQRQIARVWLRFPFFPLSVVPLQNDFSQFYAKLKNVLLQMPNSIHSTYIHTQNVIIVFIVIKLNFFTLNEFSSIQSFASSLFFHQQYWVNSAEKNLGNWVMRMCVLFYFASAAAFR